MFLCLQMIIVISFISKSSKLSDVTYLCIVLIQETYDTNIVFERNYVRLGKGFHIGQVRRRGVQSTKHILRESN